MANFVYVLFDERSGEAAVIDSGWETGSITGAIEKLGAKVKYAIASHGHFDHTSTLQELADKTGADVVAHDSSALTCQKRVSDGDQLRLGSSALRILHTPGHTQDSICVHDGRNVFTGDTLFVGTIGKFERDDAAVMYKSLIGVLLRLPANTVVYPGHDYGELPSRSLAEEAASNPFLMARDLRSFQSLFS